MKFISKYKNFYKVGDIVQIKYWYKPGGNVMITPVEIIESKRGSFLVSHNIPVSKIQNAPDELIEKTKIISKFEDYNKSLISK